MFQVKPPPGIERFSGLNNVTDPLKLGLGWLAVANNVNVSDAGAVAKREGYGAPTAGDFTGMYATQDFQRMYLVDAGNLRTYEGALLKTGISPNPMYWAEVNQDVFFNNGVSAGVVKTDGTVQDWRWTPPAAPTLTAVTGNLPAGLYQVRATSCMEDGRELGAGISSEIALTEGQALQISGLAAGSRIYIAPANSSVYQFAGTYSGSFVWNSNPDSLGRDLVNNFYESLPFGADVIEHWKGRIYAAQYFPEANQTAIWFSQPLGFHLFNLNTDYILVPGRVHMLAAHDTALLIGTDAKIYAYDPTSLTELADYGVVPGQHWCSDDKQTYFWSTRGLCKALPFSNLTERSVSVAPGVQAGGTIVHSGGQKRFVVALHQGGSAFNAYS